MKMLAAVPKEPEEMMPTKPGVLEKYDETTITTPPWGRTETLA